MTRRPTDAPVGLGRDTLLTRQAAIAVLKGNPRSTLQLRPRQCGSVTSSDGMLFPNSPETTGEPMFTRCEGAIASLSRSSGQGQSLEGTRERHAAYGPDVKCYWLFRKLPSPIGQRADPDQLERLTAERDLPIFRLSLADSGFNVIVDHKTLSLRDFVAARLERRIRFCEQRNYTVSQVQLVVCTVECWKPSCRSRYEVFYTRRILRSDCGAEHVEREPGEVDILAQNPHSALRNWHVVKELFATEAKDL